MTAGKGGKNIDLLRKPLNMNMCFEVKDIKKTEVCTAVMAEILLNNYQGLNVIVTENPDLQNCNDVIYVEKGKDCDEYLDEADFLLAETYTKSFGEYPGDLSYKCDIDHGKFKDEKDCEFYVNVSMHSVTSSSCLQICLILSLSINTSTRHRQKRLRWIEVLRG